MEKMPEIIVGGLPSVDEIKANSFNHRIIHVHETPDGRSERCACGWESGIIGNTDDLDRAWNGHIDTFESR